MDRYYYKIKDDISKPCGVKQAARQYGSRPTVHGCDSTPASIRRNLRPSTNSEEFKIS